MVTLRRTKGAPLTHDEMDNNFAEIAGKLGSANPSTSGLFTHAGDFNASGKVGVGTSNPAHKVVVSNNGVEGLEIGPGAVSGKVLVQAYNRASPGYAAINVTCTEFLVTTPAGLGYGQGAGGTAIQPTSKSTAVPINKPCGQITMHPSPLAPGATVSFSITNAFIGLTDALALSFVAPGINYTNYNVWHHVSAGSATIYVKNISGVSLSEAVVIGFRVIKGATA